MKIKLTGALSYVDSNIKFAVNQIQEVDNEISEKLLATGMFEKVSGKKDVNKESDKSDKNELPNGVIQMSEDGKSIGAGVAKFKCPICKKEYKSEQAVKMHMKKKHKEMKTSHKL